MPATGDDQFLLWFTGAWLLLAAVAYWPFPSPLSRARTKPGRRSRPF